MDMWTASVRRQYQRGPSLCKRSDGRGGRSDRTAAAAGEAGPPATNDGVARGC